MGYGGMEYCTGTCTAAQRLRERIDELERERERLLGALREWEAPRCAVCGADADPACLEAGRRLCERCAGGVCGPPTRWSASSPASPSERRPATSGGDDRSPCSCATGAASSGGPSCGTCERDLPPAAPCYTQGFFRPPIAFNQPVRTLGIIGGEIEGRLVQVRRGVGHFGSDILFLRMPDGRLQTAENVAIFPISRDLPVFDGDTPTQTYDIAGEWPETGFLIDHPRQPPSYVQDFGIRIETREDPHA